LRIQPPCRDDNNPITETKSYELLFWTEGGIKLAAICQQNGGHCCAKRLSISQS